MAVRTLTYVLLGRDELSPVARKAGAEVEGVFGKLGKMAGMLGVTTGIAAIGVESVKAATSFQSSMEKIHTQAGASQKSIGMLSNAVLQLGMHAQQSPKELADALYHLKSVGLDNADAMKALKQASDLAAVGGADLESTTNALAGAWRSGIKGAESFGKTASTVNAIIGAGNMRMEDFTAAIGTGILPAAKTFGVSLQSVGSALALMTDEGVPADDAATRLKMSLSLLGAPSQAAEKQLKRIGLTGLDLANAMRGPQGLVGAVSLLKTHLDRSGMSASETAALLSRAFGGGRSSSAILTMVNNLDVLKKKQEQVNSSTNKYGDAVIQQRKTAAAQFAILRSTLDVLSIRLGNALLPPLTKFAQFLTSTAIPKMLAFGRAIGPSVKEAFGIFAAGLATIVKLFNAVPGPVKIATAALVGLEVVMRLAAAANPWILLATAVVLAIGIMSKHWTMFSRVLKDIGSGFLFFAELVIKENKFIVDAFLSMVGTILHGAATAFGWVPGLGSKLKAASRGFDDFKGHVDNVFNGMTGTIEKWRAELTGSAAASKRASDSIVKDFTRQNAAAWQASGALNKYTKEIRQNGVNSDNAKQARDKLYKDLVDAGVKSDQARKDVNGYSDAVRRNGVESNQAWSARVRLAEDIRRAFLNSRTGRQDMDALTMAIRRHGTNSDQTRAARLRLETDLINAGIDSRTAKSLVDKLQSSINAMHGKAVNVGVHASGSGSVKIVSSGIAAAGQGNIRFMAQAATGGHIRGPGGPTSDTAGLFALSNNEYVVRAASTAKYGVRAMDAVNEGRAVIGYAGGGLIGIINNLASNASRYENADAAKAERAAANAAIAWLKQQSKAMFGNAGPPVNYHAGAGVAQWAPIILAALHMLGQSSQWLGTVERRMNQESGGNPNIVNKWDSNWLAGHPSVGLMQVISGTYAAYSGPFRHTGPFAYGVSVSPLANVYAGLNYALHRYGSLSALNRPGGYAYGGLVSFDQGGWLPPRSATLAINGTNSYERVGHAGGNTYIINISPTPLARPADIGREVVESIKAFERGSGKGWRS